MATGLDPKSSALAKFLADAPERAETTRSLNYLEPQFPWKVVGLDPGTFGLDSLPDPGDVRVPVIPGLLQR